MRIISQDKSLDVNYDAINISMVKSRFDNKFRIYASVTLLQDDSDLLGVYETEERALEVMQEIREYSNEMYKESYPFTMTEFFEMPER